MLHRDARNITHLLVAWRGGNHQALSELMPLVYQRLKVIASRLMRQERQHHTLETTALVHEAYMRLAPLERIDWNDRAHFFAMCARIMRRTLVDRARYHSREKRKAGDQRAETTQVRRLTDESAPNLIALDDALQDLAKHDAQTAQIVELRFFGGLDREAIAEVLGISSATVTRRWRSARAWLINYLQQEVG